MSSTILYLNFKKIKRHNFKFNFYKTKNKKGKGDTIATNE